MACIAPRYGKPFLSVFLRAAAQHAQLAWWTIDSGDSLTLPPAIDRTIAAAKRARGGVVLMHDYSQRAGDHGRYIVEATGRLLQLARHEGFAVKRMRELLAAA